MKLRVFLLLLLSTIVATAAPKALEPASPDAAVRELFAYLIAGQGDIATDRKAQERWLTKSLRRALTSASTAATKAAKAHPNEKIDAPSNETLLAAWDKPTSFSVSASKATPPTGRVELLYTWGPKTNYPGETRTMSVLLIQEDGAWRVDDIQSHKSKFSEEGTLRQDLRALAAQK